MRIYYADGSTYDGPVQEAPAFGVVCIVQVEDGVRVVTSGGDFYVWRDGLWVDVDWFGLVDYLQEAGWKRVLFGRTITTARFQEVMRRADAERVSHD